MKNSIQLGVFAALAAVAGVIVAAFVFAPKTISVQSGTLLQQPRPIADFTLQGIDGQPFTRRSFEGHWSLVFTGFTHCPDVCPNTLALLKALTAKLEAASVPLQIVFISIDPERDKPENLATYVRYFDSDFIAATGPNAELDKLARSIGFVYAKVPGTTPESYTMDHSSALILINPQGQVAGYFSPPLNVETLAADFSSIIGKS